MQFLPSHQQYSRINLQSASRIPVDDFVLWSLVKTHCIITILGRSKPCLLPSAGLSVATVFCLPVLFQLICNSPTRFSSSLFLFSPNKTTWNFHINLIFQVTIYERLSPLSKTSIFKSFQNAIVNENQMSCLTKLVYYYVL